MLKSDAGQQGIADISDEMLVEAKRWRPIDDCLEQKCQLRHIYSVFKIGFAYEWLPFFLAILNIKMSIIYRDQN